MSAPRSMGRFTRLSWSGCDYAHDEDCHVELFADTTVTAGYLPAGSISGRATGGGIPLASVRVWASPVSGPRVEAVTGTSGDYEITGLAPGSYKVKFDWAPGFPGEWYDDKPDEASAAGVVVTAGSTTTGIDADLAPTGGISGRVTGVGGVVLQGVSVNVADCPCQGSSSTDANGFCRVTGCQAGICKVRFEGASGFLGEWYDDKPDYQTATAVAVTPGKTTNGIDADWSGEGGSQGK